MDAGEKVRTIVKSSQKSTVQRNVTLGDVLVQNQGSAVIYSVPAGARAQSNPIAW